MSSQELTEWAAYFRIEPDGERRADARIGILTSVLANVYRDRVERPEPYTPEDFVPRFGGAATQPAGQTVNAMRGMIEHLNAALGGVDLRG